MPYLVAAVVLVGVLSVLNLLLAVGIIRRLRERSAPAQLVPPGTRVGEFAARTVDGEPVSRDLLAGETLVAFLAPDCAPCQQLRPGFVAAARDLPGGREQVLAVLLSRPDDPAVSAEAAELSTVARVVVEEYGGPVATAFQASGFPALYLLGTDGAVVASGGTLHELPLPVAR